MKKQLISFLSVLFLFSCSTAKETEKNPNPSVTTSETETINTTSESESSSLTINETDDASDSAIHQGIHKLTSEDIPNTEQSKYNNDFDFDGGGVSYYGDFIQQGHGEYEKTIQMKKEVSYLYNTVAVKGKLTLSVKDKGDYTGTPTLYLGDKENPETQRDWTSVRQENSAILYEANITSYFRISDESSFALYLNYLQINCD